MIIKRTLSFLLILILIAALLTFGESVRISGNDLTHDAQPAESMSSEYTTVNQKREIRTRILISAAGDCTLGSDRLYSYANSFEAYYDKYGYQYFFNNVRPLFINDDFTVINLECALTDAEKYAEKQYVYKGKPEYAKILSYGGIELVSLANNHSKDYLNRGFQDTICALNKEGVEYACNDKIQLMQKNDVKAAFISVCSWNCSDAVLKKYFNEAEQAGADITILCVHWGVNYEANYDDAQTYFGHLAVDLGADLVLGHHPHILQGIEIYQGVPIVYSLGNFCYAGKKYLGDEIHTMIFQMQFDFMGEKLIGTKYDVIPTYMSSENPKNTYRPTIVTDPSEKAEILDNIYYLSKNLNLRSAETRRSSGKAVMHQDTVLGY